MSTLQVIIFVLLYIAVGSGVFWLVNKYDEAIQRKLTKKYPDNTEEILEEYKKFGQWIPKVEKPGSALIKIALVGFVAAILAWGLWPVSAIVGIFWCLIKYKIICKRHGS
jgi:hypothetical protein